jgi:hypothetical protein
MSKLQKNWQTITINIHLKLIHKCISYRKSENNIKNLKMNRLNISICQINTKNKLMICKINYNPENRSWLKRKSITLWQYKNRMKIS